MAAEQGADIAATLLSMVIRAIDYTPPIHISFGDLLSALLTADAEVRTDDSRYELRRHLRTAMADYGITPASTTRTGLWRPPAKKLQRSGVHLGALQTDPTEMFRHIWNNRDVLNLNPEAYTRVASVRPCLRISPMTAPRSTRRSSNAPSTCGSRVRNCRPTTFGRRRGWEQTRLWHLRAAPR